MGYFLLFYLPNNPKNQNLANVKKTPSVPKIMIICCTVHEIWCMTDVIIFHFGPFFALLPPFFHFFKIKILKKWKETPRDIIILHKCTKNHDHMLYYLWDMACDRCNCYFSFWAILYPFTPNRPKNQNFKNHHLDMCTTNYNQMMYGSWDMVCNGWTDRRTEKVTYRGGSPT